MAVSNDLSTAAFMRGFRRNPQPPPAPIEAPTGAPSQLEGFQGSPVVTYYIPDYQGTGPMYVTTGFAGWEWMRPDDYQRRLAAGEIPPATLGGADFDRMYAAYEAQAAQARAATPAIAASQLAMARDATLPMERRIQALHVYIANMGTAGMPQQRLQQMYQALQAAPQDVLDAYIAKQDASLRNFGGMGFDGPRWWRGEFTAQAPGAAPAPQPAAALPPLDIYNPAPFLAALARRESNIPLPRANQLTPLFFKRATPTQLEFLGGLASNKGIPEADYFAEALRFQPSGRIGSLPRWRT